MQLSGQGIGTLIKQGVRLVHDTTPFPPIGVYTVSMYTAGPPSDITHASSEGQVIVDTNLCSS